MTTSVIPPGMFKCSTCGYFHEASPCPVCTPSVPHDREASTVAMRAVLTFHPDLTPDKASSLVHRAEQNQDYEGLVSVVQLARPGLVYHCTRCQKWYRKGNSYCAVLHNPGDCCHYGDEEVHEPRPVHYQERRSDDA